MISLLFMLALAAPPQSSAPCDESPTTDVLAKVIAPMTGRAPVWMVDGNRGHWGGADFPAKTVWVFAHPVKNVRIDGRRLDGAGAVTIRTGNDAPSPVLVIPDPAAWSVTPGGASAETMKQYAFVMSHVFYPSPGCYELTIRIGDRQVRIVRELKLQQ